MTITTEGFPELPPGYSWVVEGNDIDLVAVDCVPDDYPLCNGLMLIAWVHTDFSEGVHAHERRRSDGAHTFHQIVASREEALALLATRLCLGMNAQ